MARPTVLTQGNKNYFLLMLVIILVLGIAWGSLVEVKAGIIYSTIFLFTIGVLSLIMLWVNEEDRKTMKEYFRTPIYSSTLASMGMFVFGIVIVFGMNLIGKITNSFSTTNFYGSLYFSGNSLSKNFLSQTFQAGAIESSKLGEFYYSCIVAPIGEELTWGFALYLLFYTLGIGLVKGFFKGKAPFGLKNKTFYTIIGLLGVFLTFMFVHRLNESYVGYMFLIAGIFRLLVNLSMYVWGMALSFAIGVHMANNTSAFIQQNGFGTLISTLIGSPYGWVFLIGFGTLVIYVLRNLDKVLAEIKQEMKGYNS